MSMRLIPSLVCDFCTAPNPPFRIPCRSFDLQPIDGVKPMVSLKDFMACPECWRLVQAEDREGLYQRAKTSFLQQHAEMWHPEADAALRDFYDRFWASRL